MRRQCSSQGKAWPNLPYSHREVPSSHSSSAPGPCSNAMGAGTRLSTPGWLTRPGHSSSRQTPTRQMHGQSYARSKHRALSPSSESLSLQGQAGLPVASSKSSTSGQWTGIRGMSGCFGRQRQPWTASRWSKKRSGPERTTPWPGPSSRRTASIPHACVPLPVSRGRQWPGCRPRVRQHSRKSIQRP